MSIFDLLADILGYFGPPRADHDRSIVGLSPIEERANRFCHRLALVLFLAAGAAAFYVWVLPALWSALISEVVRGALSSRTIPAGLFAFSASLNSLR